MKLVLAIVSSDDTNAVIKALNKERYQITKLATTGGFLSKGNTTMIVGCDDDKVQQVIDLIGNESNRRTEYVQTNALFETGRMVPTPVEVTVGGATIFVLDVDQFIKL